MPILADERLQRNVEDWEKSITMQGKFQGWDKHFEAQHFVAATSDVTHEYVKPLNQQSATGKNKPWSTHKSASLLLADSFERLHLFNKADAVKHCGTTLRFAVCPNGHEQKIRYASFCRVRLCPMCAWRRSLKVSTQVRDIAHLAGQQFKLRWIFLTLTCKNVGEDKLADQLDLMTKSFSRLTKRKVFMGSVLGFFRALEVTRNPVTGTYHPHFHVLLAVAPSYFNGKGYVKQSEWIAEWRSAMKVDYDPIVDIRVVKGKRNQKIEERLLRQRGIELVNGQAVEVDPEVQLEANFLLDEAAIAEISKYSLKPKDYIIRGDNNLTDRVVSTFERNLNHRRLFAFGGILKDIYEYLKSQKAIEDAESDMADLLNFGEPDSCQCSVCRSDMLEELYRWVPAAGNYMQPKFDPKDYRQKKDSGDD